MKFIKITFVFLFSLIITFSCNTDDFEVISDWEDITVVYGLLDQRDQTIYLKINKAFLGPGDALTYAAEKDSSNYNNKLDVKIEEYDTYGSLRRTFLFDTTTLYVKDTGVFYSPDQPLYQYSFADNDFAKIEWDVNLPYDTVGLDTFWLFDNYIYKLKIYNQALNKLITSETLTVGNFIIDKPISTNIGFENEDNHEVTFGWIAPLIGSDPNDQPTLLYELNLDFTYVENYFGGESDTLKISLLSTTTTLETYTYTSTNFFSTCANKIPYEDASMEETVQNRKLNDIVITVSVAAEDFYKYMMVFQPSSGIVQEKPNFTNVENGIGIFSSRIRKVREKHVQAEGTLEDLQALNIKF